MGIQLDRADAANGQLWFLPGSHRHGGPLGDPWADGYPTVAIDADPGDVTVHFGHVLHAAPASVGPRCRASGDLPRLLEARAVRRQPVTIAVRIAASSAGRARNGEWSPGRVCTVAPMRAAMARWESASRMGSSSQTM